MRPRLFLGSNSWVARNLSSRFRWRIIRKEVRHLHISFDGSLDFKESIEVIRICNGSHRIADLLGKWRNGERVKRQGIPHGVKALQYP